MTPIYVDPMRRTPETKQWPYSESCHLYSANTAKLHLFAEMIGLKREWFHDHKTLPHYDLTRRMRKRAVAAGAVEVTAQELVRELQKRRKATNNGEADA